MTPMPAEVTVSRAALRKAARVQQSPRAWLALLFIVLPLLGGCGFHLRGEGGIAGSSATRESTEQSSPTPGHGNATAARQLPAVQLQIDRARTPLAAAVASAISSADIRVVGVGATAQPSSASAAGAAALPAGEANAELPWRVRISGQNEERRGRTLTRGIQVAEYELTVALEFEVLDAAGAPVHATQRLAASRVYSREQENLLTNEAEEDVLWDELRRDVAAQLAAAVGVQLSSAARRPAPVSSAAGQ